MVNPRLTCRRHLLGEHVELHMFVGTLNKGVSVQGYLEDGLLEPISLYERHDALVAEILRRGYHHNSPLPSLVNSLATIFSQSQLRVRIPEERSLRELASRCPDCEARQWAETYRLAR